MTAANQVTEEQINFYRENGFVKLENMLTGEELEQLREYLEEAMQEEGSRSVKTDQKDGTYYRVLNQKVNTWRDHGGMAKFSFHEKFAKAALELTGSNEIRFFHDHGLWKMPGDSKPTPWHQDTPYWPVNEPEKGMLSIWIALDDVDEKNGCMAFVPKSHRIGKLNPIDLVNPQNIFDALEDGKLEDSKPVIVPLKAGSCTFHNGLTFHYAHANSTDRPRRALAIIYMPDGITFSGKPHTVTEGQKLEKGQPVKGPLFPLLAKRHA
ncbi:phytanoyl-CoA dioxygenase family protein [Paenibacillus pasadenensis]|uniref:phytanoyl-CoA dioxygenase family protein n=1 Tax=Paenibacillus pasadenensis TaxID=217090 RepID=UPI002040D9DB|nr:phytanoyl-CoA dioxygenase family protein [Paenibacillus pasadenensis]MCM3748706.1 phytanoyl-CoA dioxygenase family protein [Paenibacillus pasadenensis]